MTSSATCSSPENRSSSWCCWRGVSRQDLVRKHPAGLIQGIRGPTAPMVEFLLNASAAFIQGVAGQVHDVEGVHDCPCVGEFFGGSALEPGESIHSDDLDTLTPRVGLGGQPGFEDLFGAARDHVQEPGGTAAVADGRQVQDDGDIFVSVGGVAPPSDDGRLAP